MPDINGIPYVESTDLVSGYPSVSQSLAQEVSDQLASKLAAADQTFVQFVRDTDSSDRTTTSTSFVDATSLDITITPTSATNAVWLLAYFTAAPSGGTGYFQWTDSSNNAISGAEGLIEGQDTTNPTLVLAYATPATTSATTYKIRFRASAGTNRIRGSVTTTQLIAIEVNP